MHQLIRINLKLPIDSHSQSFVSWIYEKANVIDVNYNDFILLDIECNTKISGKIISECKKLKGKINFN